MDTAPPTEQTTTTDVAAVVDGHLAAYSERDRARREGLIDAVWAEDGRLIDPPLTGEGHRGISDLAEAVHAQFAGHTFRRTTAVDVHHGQLRYGWDLVDPGGQPALSGIDVGELDGDGRLRRIVGFFGPIAPREDA